MYGDKYQGTPLKEGKVQTWVQIPIDLEWCRNKCWTECQRDKYSNSDVHNLRKWKE